MKKYIMKGLLPLRVLLYRKNVIKVCSECEEIINFGKYFGSGFSGGYLPFGSGWGMKITRRYKFMQILFKKMKIYA